MSNRYTTDIGRQTLTVNGEKRLPYQWNGLPDELAHFLTEWFNPDKCLGVHTSGSTGTPKELRVEKSRMMNSALMTLSFLGLRRGDSALLCMPLKYIAGKMVVVRSLVGELNLIPLSPTGHPLKGLTESPTFAAMIPMQVYNTLQDAEETRLLKGVKHLIIGGGAIDEKLERALSQFPNDVWSTYGMTETLSHIALRRLNGKDASEWYTPLPHVEVKASAEGTLIIHAPEVCEDTLQTNDLVEFDPKGRFRILGRKDNTINTGGVKVQTEEVESALRPHLPYPFLITSVADEKFGERIVLLLEATDEALTAAEAEKAIQTLPPYWRPKQVIRINALPLTETGKPDRAHAKRLAANLSTPSQDTL